MEEKDKTWSTDFEPHRRWCDDCEVKYKGLRECPDCGGRNTGIDEVVLRPLRNPPKNTK